MSARQEGLQPAVGRLRHHGRLWDHDRIVVPRRKVRFAVTQCRTGILRGHWGPRKTFDLVARQYVFSNMKQLVAEFVHVCHMCQHVNPNRPGEQGLLQPLPSHAAPQYQLILRNSKSELSHTNPDYRPRPLSHRTWHQWRRIHQGHRHRTWSQTRALDMLLMRIHVFWGKIAAVDSPRRKMG